MAVAAPGALALLAGAVALVRRRRLARPKAGGGDAGPSTVRRGEAVGLQGNLAQTPMHDLLQLLALGRRTGVLEVFSGRRAGTIAMRHGHVVHNAFRGKEGLDGLFLLLDLKEGDFEFYERSVEQGAVAVEVVDAIMLWMNRTPERKP